MKKIALTFLLSVAFTIIRAQQKTATVPVDKITKLANAQYSAYVKKYTDSTRYAQCTGPDGALKETSAGDWVSGFFPGCLWYMYQLTGNKSYEKDAKRWTAGLESQKNNKGTHDLGFMLYCSFGIGYKITHDEAYKAILLQASKSLSTRFHPEVGAIRSWDNKEFHYPVIIDNLMNLEMLFWATKKSGDSSFYKIALAHANTDIKYRWRADNSSYHVLDFDPVTGKLLKQMTHQGYADNTCWARGQAWGIYGYTVLYRETHDRRFLTQAIKAADYFLAQTDKIPDHIPYWDFQAPDVPDAPRDASAAAVTASGLFELSKYAGKNNPYYQKAVQLLNALSTDKYLATAGSNNYFLLKHSTGHKPHNSQIDVPIIYADYYYLEALWRYKNYNKLDLSKS